MIKKGLSWVIRVVLFIDYDDASHFPKKNITGMYEKGAQSWIKEMIK